MQGLMYSYGESEAELRAILEAEKWEKYYEEQEALWKDEFSFLNSKIPNGYYECDIYEPINSVELGDFDLINEYNEIYNREVETEDETEYLVTIESDIRHYYCKEELINQAEFEARFPIGCCHVWVNYSCKHKVRRDMKKGIHEPTIYKKLEEYDRLRDKEIGELKLEKSKCRR